jgi:hypothetical protein
LIPFRAAGVPERHFKWDHMIATPAMLVDLIKEYKYRIGHIGDAQKHLSSGWDTDLLALKEVRMGLLSVWQILIGAALQDQRVALDPTGGSAAQHVDSTHVVMSSQRE